MITTIQITKNFDFTSLKKGGLLACEFHINIHDYPKTYRFKIFPIVKVRLKIIFISITKCLQKAIVT